MLLQHIPLVPDEPLVLPCRGRGRPRLNAEDQIASGIGGRISGGDRGDHPNQKNLAPNKKCGKTFFTIKKSKGKKLGVGTPRISFRPHWGSLIDNAEKHGFWTNRGGSLVT